MSKNNLTKKLGLMGLGAILAFNSGCATTNPNTIVGQTNQYIASSKKVEEMRNKPKVVENNPFKYSIEDLTNAYASGCMDFSFNEKAKFAGYTRNSAEWAENFINTLQNYNSKRIDNQMACYASKQVLDEAKKWRSNSYWTEPLSLSLWMGAINMYRSSNKSYSSTSEPTPEVPPSSPPTTSPSTPTFGTGSSTGIGGIGIK